MIANRRSFAYTAGAALIAAVTVLPAGVSFAAERDLVPALPYELDRLAPPAASDQAPLPALSSSTPAPALASASVDEASQRCIAKIVHHEARNQPRAGMLAVAQTLLNRLKAGGRFGSSICGVATQPGQYFDIHAYHPREDGDWQTAMDVARDALSGEAETVAPGALFFRAAYRPATSFFRSRQRVASVGDQIFYR